MGDSVYIEAWSASRSSHLRQSAASAERCLTRQRKSQSHFRDSLHLSATSSLSPYYQAPSSVFPVATPLLNHVNRVSLTSKMYFGYGFGHPYASPYSYYGSGSIWNRGRYGWGPNYGLGGLGGYGGWYSPYSYAYSSPYVAAMAAPSVVF